MLSRLSAPRLPLVSRAILVPFACLALVGASVLPSTSVANAAGTTYWVNDNAPQGYQNNPGKNCNKPGYSDINDAIQDSSNGDTIKVCDGTYESSTQDPYDDTESIVIDRDVTVVGQGNRENVVLRNDADAVVLINASGATLQNVLVRDDCGDSSDHGILVEDSVLNVSILGNHVTSCSGIGPDVGIEINQNSSALVDKNLVENYLEVGIFVAGDSFAKISNNTVNGTAGPNGNGPRGDNPQVGIAIQGADADVVKNTVAGNSLASSPSNGNGLPSVGIGLQGSNGVFVDSNTTRFNNVGIGLAGANNNLIQRNFSNNNLDSGADLDLDRDGVGIGVSFSRDNRILNNQTIFNDREGILLIGEVANEIVDVADSQTVNNTVQGNTVIGNDGAGIQLEGADGNFVLTNRINGNASGLTVIGGDGNSIRNNNPISGNEGNGITLMPLVDPDDGTPIALANGNQISGNTVTGNQNLGISLESSSNNSITNNTVEKNGSNGIELNGRVYGPSDDLLESNENTISSNLSVKENGDSGIALNGGSNGNTVQGNNASKNGDHGIAIFACLADDCTFDFFSNDNQILNNTTEKNSDDGLFGGEDTEDNNFQNNKSSSNGEHDCHDDSGVFGDPEDEWLTNTGNTQNRPALCKTKKGADANVISPTFGTEELPN